MRSRRRRPVVKVHKCSEHWARSFDAREWDALPLVGWMPDGAGGWIELRFCRCRSSIAIELTSAEMQVRRERFTPPAANMNGGTTWMTK